MPAYVMVPPRWLAISHSMIAALRLPAMKSTALPLACREGRPVPAIMAPGRHVDITFTGPNCCSMRSSRARAAAVKQVRGASGESRKAGAATASAGLSCNELCREPDGSSGQDKRC